MGARSRTVHYPDRRRGVVLVEGTPNEVQSYQRVIEAYIGGAADEEEDE